MITHTTKLVLATTALVASAQVAQAQVADSGRLETVLDRSSLLCTGNNDSFLGFAEVDHQGNRNGVDIDLCEALAAGPSGASEGHL